jgi:mono/diheme cytochrome c family protein
VRSVLAFSLVVAGVSACYTGSKTDNNWVPDYVPQTTTELNPTEPADPSGLPCDVAQLINDSCISCHGKNLQGMATSQFLTPADVRTAAKAALARMRDDQSPMPPAGKLGADKIALFSAWVAAGMPAGTCGGEAADAAPPAVTLTCTSGTYWTRGNHASGQMKPGGQCIDCHLNGDDDDDSVAAAGTNPPLFTFAGTVFGGPHDKDDCNGASGASADIQVILTGADGTEINLAPNAAGNFFTLTPLVAPVHARVMNANGTRVMKDELKSGNCNSCHTADSPSPGRITSTLAP